MAGIGANDESIQYTNNEATNFKYYAINKGYWKDEHVKYFCKVNNTNEYEHKAPEMSRGYYARVHGIRNIVNKFLLKTNFNCYLINIGCGFDTLYFNLKQNNKLPLKYVEFDFSNVCRAKFRQIKVKNLLQNEQNVEYAPNQAEIKSQVYNLQTCDLRNINELKDKLDKLALDASIPTLIISECVLIYMANDKSTELINLLSSRFTNSFYLNYEPYNLNDRFGQIMIENMENRSCKLLGIDACLSESTQLMRFNNNGYKCIKLISMTKYYNEYIDVNDRRRIESIEFLDEVELLFQLLDHYCLSLASNNDLLNLDDLFNTNGNNYL